MSDTSASELEVVFTPGQAHEEDHNDGDLVIVETSVCDMEVDPLSMDRNQDSVLLKLKLQSVPNPNAQAQQKQTRSGRSTVKHYPAVDRVMSKYKYIACCV